MTLDDLAVEPWYRPGKIPVLAMLIVTAALIVAQFVSRPLRWGIGEGGFHESSTSYPHGWPASCLHRIDTERIDLNPWSGIPTTWTTNHYWKPAGLVIDGFAALVLPLSTLFVFERWRCGGWQFSIRSLMVLVAVAAGAVFLGRYEPAFLGTIDRDGSLLSVAVSVPLAVGVGCAIFTLSWLALVPFEVVWQAAHGRDPWA
jgi:hypothetical protein